MNQLDENCVDELMKTCQPGKRGAVCRVPFGLITVPLVRILSMTYMTMKYYENESQKLNIAVENKDREVMEKIGKGPEDYEAAGNLSTLDDFIPFYGVFTAILLVHLLWVLSLATHHLRQGVRLMLQDKDYGGYLDDHVTKYLNAFGSLLCGIIISIFVSPPALFVGIGAAVTCAVVNVDHETAYETSTTY